MYTNIGIDAGVNSVKRAFDRYPDSDRPDKNIIDLLELSLKGNYFVFNGRKEGNVLFNDALNTFYLRLDGVGHNMVKDHSYSETGNPLPPHGLLFPISSKLFYMHHPTDRIAHTTAFGSPVVEHCLNREI